MIHQRVIIISVDLIPIIIPYMKISVSDRNKNTEIDNFTLSENSQSSELHSICM